MIFFAFIRGDAVFSRDFTGCKSLSAGSSGAPFDSRRAEMALTETLSFSLVCSDEPSLKPVNDGLFSSAQGKEAALSVHKCLTAINQVKTRLF